MYNILRTKKIKTRANLTSASEHNLRLRGQSNIDPTRTPLNRVVFDAFGVGGSKDPSDFQKSLTAHYEALGVKEKKDNVLALEFICSASPEFFETADVDDWTSKQIDFFSQEFGENVKLVVLHMDEKTPHLHVFVSTEEKKTRKYKNQYGEHTKETVNLNARRWNPKFLTDLHTRHALHNKDFGLVRGQTKSTAQHAPLKGFYGDREAKLQSELDKVAKEKSKLAMFESMKNIIMFFSKTLEDMFGLLEKHDLSDADQAQLDTLRHRVDAITGGAPPTPKNPKA